MKKRLFSLVFVLALCAPTFAQESQAPAPSSASSDLIFLKSGDIVFGGRVALGGVAGASFGFSGIAEYGIGDNLGIGGFFGYSGYSNNYGTWEANYANILILGSVNYHRDFLKIQNLDTWGAVSLGYNVASAEARATVGNAIVPAVSAGGFVWGVTANARYYFTPNLALSASLGYGLGYLQVGLDYKL
ncbi:MAG: hypothetical protein NZM06_11920 [Chloroherpetonaceae bacterium]|nr:hypothetical protein [Chloroherpetonaceae bacterium]MDW8437969.1 hypothetical protein [Chloroherpetonaceae bacterium]